MDFHLANQMDAVDSLHSINPSVVPILYENRDRVVNHKVLEAMTNFRKLDTIDRLGLLKHMTQTAAIGADERKHSVTMETLERIKDITEKGYTDRTNLEQTGMTDRVRIHDSGLTKRAEIDSDLNKHLSNNELKGRTVESNNWVATEAMKYAVRAKISEDDRLKAQYLSDNELRALRLEAEAQYGIVQFLGNLERQKVSEENRSLVLREINSAEHEYRMKVFQAEQERLKLHDTQDMDLVNRYLDAQTQLLRLSAEHALRRDEFKHLETMHAQKLMGELYISALKWAKSQGKNSFSIEGYLPGNQSFGFRGKLE